MGHYLRLKKAGVQSKRPKPSSSQSHGCYLKSSHLFYHTAVVKGGAGKGRPRPSASSRRLCDGSVPRISTRQTAVTLDR